MANESGPAKVKLTKEMIEEMKKAVEKLEGKELEQGRLMDMSPGVSTAWYIAYST